MARFQVVEVYGSGKGGPYYVRDADGQYEDSPKDFRLKSQALRYAARMQKKAGSSRGNPRKKRNCRNPKQLLFKSRAAAVAYAKSHGAKKFSVRKLKRGK